MLEIKVIDPEGRERSLEIDSPKASIGRHEDCDIVLDDDSCSRRHAEIIKESGSYKIVDLGSSNGIVVGGKKLSQVQITEGIEVTVGRHRLVFSLTQLSEDRTVMLDDMEAHIAAAEASLRDQRQEGPSLKLLYDTKQGRRLFRVVAGGSYIVGRSPSADVVLDSRKVSKKHARFSFRGPDLVVDDLDSANGVLVNGERVTGHTVKVGDVVSIGDTDFEIKPNAFDLDDEAVLVARTQVMSPAKARELAAELHAQQGRGPAATASPSPSEIANARLAPGRSDASDQQPAMSASSKSRVGLYAGIGGVLLIAVVGLLALWQRGRNDDEAPPTGTAVEQAAASQLVVRVAEVQRKEIARDIVGVGSVKPSRTATVSSEVSGRIVALPIDQGSRVRSGDLIVQVNDADIRLQMQEVRSAISIAQVQLAKDDFDRKQSLFDQGVVTRSVLNQSKNNYLTLDSSYKTAQARLGQLRELQSKTRITAPISGVVTQRFVNPGEVLGPGIPVARLENLDRVLIVFGVTDREVVELAIGQSAEATVDAFAGEIFGGVIDKIGSSANPATRTFEVEARIDNTDARLRSGMISTVRVVLERSEGLVAPAEAIVEQEGETVVFVMRDGVAKRVAVTLGSRQDREVEIVSGLEEGDRVIVSGLERVRDGQPVKTL